MCTGKCIKLCSITTKSGQKTNFWEKYPFVCNPNNQNSVHKRCTKIFKFVTVRLDVRIKTLERIIYLFYSKSLKSVGLTFKIKTTFRICRVSLFIKPQQHRILWLHGNPCDIGLLLRNWPVFKTFGLRNIPCCRAYKCKSLI
jgi:hypothetical protein